MTIGHYTLPAYGASADVKLVCHWFDDEKQALHAEFAPETLEPWQGEIAQ